MRGARRHNLVVAGLVALALLGVFGPHAVIAGYRVAGARPPAALIYICPLHHGSKASLAPDWPRS